MLWNIERLKATPRFDDPTKSIVTRQSIDGLIYVEPGDATCYSVEYWEPRNVIMRCGSDYYIDTRTTMMKKETNEHTRQVFRWILDILADREKPQVPERWRTGP